MHLSRVARGEMIDSGQTSVYDMFVPLENTLFRAHD